MKKYWLSLSNPTTLLFLGIIFLTLFFRLYRFESLLPMGHDQDLLSWVVKDIVADKHLRLIGQETSITGVFISPAYYYLNAIFYSIFGMSQLGGVASYTLISLLTVLSIYYVFSKLFGKSIGLLGSFFYAVTIGVSFLDRWVVPTQPTILWSVWYLFVLLSIIKGNFKILPILIILLGFILHVHIAFIPFLILIPIAFYLSSKKLSDVKKQINSKMVLISIMIFLILISPFVFFELRHGFTQTQALLNSVGMDRGEAKGINRLIEVFWTFTTSMLAILNFQGKNNWLWSIIIPVILLVSPYGLNKFKLLDKNQFILLEVWVVFNFIIQFLSKRAISEYYYNNLFILVFLFASLGVKFAYQKWNNTIIVGLILCCFFIWNLYSLLTYSSSGNGYHEHKKAVEFIRQHSLASGYPCVAINYIQNPGWASGFRYLFWKNDLKVITPGNDVAVYSIVVPAGLSANELAKSFGMIGVILPNNPKPDSTSCTKKDRQLLPPWGFTG